jgi:hypothetical protein
MILVAGNKIVILVGATTRRKICAHAVQVSANAVDVDFGAPIEGTLDAS